MVVARRVRLGVRDHSLRISTEIGQPKGRPVVGRLRLLDRSDARWIVAGGIVRGAGFASEPRHLPY